MIPCESQSIWAPAWIVHSYSGQIGEGSFSSQQEGVSDHGQSLSIIRYAHRNTLTRQSCSEGDSLFDGTYSLISVHMKAPPHGELILVRIPVWLGMDGFFNPYTS